ncbi:CLL_collapsed_G0024090.mRNA.1.CDS.1 [Saccharomyces cerevisiae]|uniref:K7_Ssf1p n=1 Tax=Saccharomyces cerevisiae (strain Kyokai no. 7 / NBRC 101557) TaxID=721032 RepID=G2WFD8_YEASK|nr:ADQ_G0024060.mRNA.1.CDS.1 [Saccharomyces cerevisiae]GAA23781.1 K7_Ssf1p [Saccharomyces cerevisiae Kyokai no. 7]CAI4513508.1 CLN_G0024230.mRNA.1.CDS.1 [Saccharomyces cerevisiae]CAI5259219.1 CLL_HP2_G0020850.mRNA.1.CDS.1 [Saccharomyces cerevisiae]CAI6458978.1 CLL_HP2_G0020850.mRNA.1.CDS.1 [Saccharomyces cerevisiae]
MAKRRQKKRTHAQLTPEQEQGIPKSMVIRVGQTSLANHSLNQLVKDFRQIMQPHTAIKLKERKSNKLKDFVVMCGPLGVTHLFMFTQSEKTGNVSLKIARTPQGPTVTFQVLDYSLGRDIKKFLKRPKSLNNDDVLNPPLLVLNGFSTSKRSGEDDQDVNVEKVIVSMFQNIFPPLNPARTSLNSIKRVFMINKDRETGEISMRHYFIDIREVEISRNLKRLYKAKNNLSKTVPNLHRKEDISSLILDHDLGAYTSESEIEDDAIVRVVDNQDVKAKHSQSLKSQRTSVEKKDNKEREKETEEEDVEMEEPKPSENLQPTPRKKAIKLTELGPRLTLKLVKIEEGICSGKVLHHEFVQKSSEEIKALEKRHAAKMRLKEQRKKEQEENIAKKKAVKDAKKQRKLERRKARAAEGGEGQGKDDAMSDDESSSSDSEHYVSVPEDLDSDLFSEVE